MIKVNEVIRDWDVQTQVPKFIQNRFKDATIVHAGSAFDKGAIGTWSDCYISELVQYKATNMLSGGMKIFNVPKNKNQEPQIILLSATKLDKVLEVSTRFMRDHFWGRLDQDGPQGVRHARHHEPEGGRRDQKEV